MVKGTKRRGGQRQTRRLKRGGDNSARMAQHMAAINGLIGAVEKAKSDEDRAALEASLNAHNKAVMALRIRNIDSYNQAAKEAEMAQPAAARAVMNLSGGRKRRARKGGKTKRRGHKNGKTHRRARK